MSVCLVVQQKERCFMCSDGAITSIIDGKNIRVSNNGVKMYIYKNDSIFCSGNVRMCNTIVNKIKKMEEVSIEDIKSVAMEEYYGESLLEIFIAKNIGDKVVTYQISSYNNFDIIERTCLDSETYILSLGYNSDSNLKILKEFVTKGGSIVEIFKNVFESISCPEVGGVITLNLIDKCGSKLIKNIDIEENVEIKRISDIKDCYFIIAKQLVGEIILGHKLYITSENGEFYIGDMEENSGFGLSIKDSSNVQRVFLGTELENGVRKARLRLYGKDGKGLVLSEEGIVSEFQFCDRSHVDSGTPMESYFRIRNNVSEIKECIISIKLRPFRVYSKGMEAGGSFTQAVTSRSGGGSTSGGGGSYTNTFNTGTGNPTWTSVVGDALTQLDTNSTLNPGRHFHPIDKLYFEHSHFGSVKVDIPLHHHSTPNHQHTTDITIDSHVHPERYGCFDLEQMPSNVSLKINGRIVESGINTDREINIERYISKNTINEIVLTSDTIGVIHFNLYCKSFVIW